MKATTILRWVIYIGIAALLFTPLIVTSSLYYPEITGKAFYFRIITEIIFGAWVILSFFDEQVRPKFSWIAIALLSLVGIALITSLTGVNPGDSIWSNFERMIGWITILHVGMLFFVSAHTLKPKHWRWLFYLSFVVSVIVGAIGLSEIGQMDRIDSQLGNPIYLAAYALIHAFLAGYFLLSRVKRAVKKGKSLLLDWQSYVFTALGVFNLIVMYFSKTRGALLGVLVGLFVTCALVAMFQRGRKWVRRTAVTGVVLALLIVGGFLAFQDSDFVRNQPVLGRFAEISLDEGNAGARLDTWQIGLEGYTKNAKTALLGWGMGNFNYVFNEYYQPEMHDDATWFDRAHNVLVEWLVATGPFGLAAYLAIFAAAVYLIWRDPKEAEALSVLEKSLLTGLLIAYLVQNLFVFDHLVSYLFFALILGWLHARHTTGVEETWLVPSWSVGKEGKVWAGMGIATVILVAGVWANLPGYNQAHTLIDALRQAQRQPQQALGTYQEAIAYQAMGTQESREQLSQSAGKIARNNKAPSEVKQKYFQQASTELEKMIEEEPGDLRHKVFYGQLLMAYGKYEQAIEQYQQANKQSGGQKQGILISLAKANQAAGNTAKALEYYKKAHELVPRFEGPAARYAAGLIYAGNVEQAKSVLNDTFGTTTVAGYSDLVRAYDHTENYDELIAILEKQNRNNSGDPQSYVSLAAAYKKSGQNQQAINVLEKAKNKFPQYSSQLDRLIQQVRSGESIQ